MSCLLATLKKLKEFAKDNPQSQRAATLVNQLYPYIVFLPEPIEATINVIRQMVAKEGGIPESLRISVTSMEAPSVYRIIDLMQQERYDKFDTQIGIAQIQKPDPRHPRGNVSFVLWKYNGDKAEPAFAPPRKDVADVVATLAATVYESGIWWRTAGQLAGSLDLTALDDLLATMLHPPARPDTFTMWAWLQRVQLAAALIIAQLDSGWETSARRRTLLDLARGPMDWSVEAAVIALWMIGRYDRVGNAEIEELYRQLLDNRPRPGSVPYERALLYCILYLNCSTDLTERARKELKDLN